MDGRIVQEIFWFPVFRTEAGGIDPRRVVGWFAENNKQMNY
jgi:hypothetical protein